LSGGWRFTVTEDKDFKKVVRDRATKTGESYATAKRHLRDPDADQGLLFARDEFVNELVYFWGEFRPSLAGLTTEEYLWEPVAGCPTIKRQADGTFRVDETFPVRGLASIAQRLCWGAQLIVVNTSQHFGDKSVTHADVTVPGDAPSGVRFLEEAITAWKTAISDCEPSWLREHSDNRSPGAIDVQFPVLQGLLFNFALLVQCATSVTLTRDFYALQRADVVSPGQR
jgi:hypothetical protein